VAVEHIPTDRTKQTNKSYHGTDIGGVLEKQFFEKMAAALVKSSLKWNKQKFDLDIDPAAPVSVLKDNIFKLTGVPVDRQKLSCPKVNNISPFVL
jgi:hypothetical protein